MSRETNSSSSGPTGRGGPSYAPGTEPYGDGPEETSERAAVGADAQAAEDEPKTETTLTTRIRINIPGSRPIPPVVMRKPVGEGEDDAEPDREAGAGETQARGGGAGPEGAAAASGAAGAPAPGDTESTRPTSDWFAPRKPPRSVPEPEPERDRAATPPDGFPAVGADGPAGRPHSGSDLLDGPPPPPRPLSGSSGTPGGRTTGPGTGDMPVPPPPGPGPGYDPFGRPVPTDAPAGASGPSLSSLYTHGPDEGPGDDRVASDTLVSGVPRVPSVDSVFPPDAPPPRPSGHGYFEDEGPGQDEVVDRGDRDDGSRGKGRSKLVLAAVSLVGVTAIAYGAGLLLDHADVPKGTTVLGVDIGGASQQDAVNTLDAALESRITDPLTLVVDGKERQIAPDVLGLTIDTEETVREATGRDYNPVSVIGSLFGGARVVEPDVQVDDEKLRSAVANLPGEGSRGAAEDGMVVFTGGKAKAVPGETHKAVDVNKAAALVEDAYRARAASGQDTPITLPVGTQQPKFGEKDLQAAVDGFGETAMSGWLWVQAGDVEIPFSQETIGTFLTMTTGEETLQPTIDLEELAATYGSAFDGVVIEGGAGTVPVQPKHVAAAMIDALREPAPALPEKRVAEVTAARNQ